jgi:glutamine cyclotransferase
MIGRPLDRFRSVLTAAGRPRLLGLLMTLTVVAAADPSSCQTNPPPAAPTTYEAVVVAERPHDRTAFTQGLELADGLFVESTGLYGSSSIRLVRPADGAIVASRPLAANLFGEGATVVDQTIWQLTWRSGTAIRYRRSDLAEIERATYDGEGWGLCHDGARLVMSDGSSTLTFRDPESFAVLGSVAVTDGGVAVGSLNELECVDGRVWANRWLTTEIVEIDPATGAVVGRLDVADLVPPEVAGSAENVANGIAHDPATGRFHLTGKRWPVIYEVELRPTG